MWHGGKAAKRSASAKGKASSATDLVKLWRHDRPRYDNLMARILDPCSVNEDGCQSIRDLLEQTETRNPSRPPHLRLCDEALARIALDAGRKPPNPEWVGNKSSGIWKALMTNSRIRTLQVKIAKQLKDGSYAAVIDEKPFQRKEQNDGDSDYADDDDVFTVQPPAPPIDAKEIEDDDEGESEEKPPGLSPTQDEEPEDQEHGEADQEDRAEDDEGGRNSDNPDTSNDDKKSSASDDKGDSSPKGSSKKKYFHSSSSK
ncbi:hypothetical protein PF005_g20304 [Phytophthora fragariae]|uniref:Uncharacterized protein n=2 Tax=Phytophthora fragariae TaxID=53985 RepID=A0A6A3R328_9STRA|nr:hypothetical protein PF007_g20031 [Phytophthora fragariae]KAE9116341.1 hypothetical protein PF006_g19071 [Phytophthora fragariae]KAE9187830.1 hypothetical protein PF005_g20304 [Phytophthora fragariae]KAE9200606.1 hypothetical protein PF004_g18961 [Phytophthora fragariae]